MQCEKLKVVSVPRCPFHQCGNMSGLFLNLPCLGGCSMRNQRFSETSTACVFGFQTFSSLDCRLIAAFCGSVSHGLCSPAFLRF
jgi:hypothetical protein